MKSIFYYTAIVFGYYLFSCEHKVPDTSHPTIAEQSWNNFHQDVKRVGMVIKIKPERLEEYLAVHKDTVAGVRDLLIKYNFRNFSIFMTQLEDGNYYEFGYFEYWGDNLDRDMKLLETEPRNKAWLELCDPMQIPLDGESSWKEMERIYSNY